MYCINYGSFDCSQGRSGSLFRKHRPSTQRSTWYAHNLFVPRGILTDIRTTALLKWSTRISLLLSS